MHTALSSEPTPAPRQSRRAATMGTLAAAFAMLVGLRYVESRMPALAEPVRLLMVLVVAWGSLQLLRLARHRTGQRRRGERRHEQRRERETMRP